MKTPTDFPEWLEERITSLHEDVENSMFTATDPAMIARHIARFSMLREIESEIELRAAEEVAEEAERVKSVFDAKRTG